MASDSRARFLEFFAGGGMARIALAPWFSCAFANDFDAAKCAAYRDNFGAEDLHPGDIAQVTAADLPDAALAWASFPCQDLSLAGGRGGMSARRSGAFWTFWRLMQDLEEEGRAPPLIVLENVPGLLTSGGGADFTALVRALAGGGYRVGGLVLDAADFVPQSRARLFVIAAKGEVPDALIGEETGYGVTSGLREAVARLPDDVSKAWVWWSLAAPQVNRARLVDFIDRDVPSDVWRSPAQFERLVSMMSPAHREALAAAEASGVFRVGAVYRRMRKGVQRAEVRYDGAAGCLRTLKGGSSRQLLLISDKGQTRLRPMLAAEGARLMGLPDEYCLPARATAAFNLLGDGVCPPVVSHISRYILSPLWRTFKQAHAMEPPGGDITHFSSGLSGSVGL